MDNNQPENMDIEIDDTENMDIEIDETNYKNFDKQTIKKYVKDKVLRKKALCFYRNNKYYNTKMKDENNNLKKKYCEICNTHLINLYRHKGTKIHDLNLNKKNL